MNNNLVILDTMIDEEFRKVFSFEHLYKSYLKCCKGTRWKTSTKNFERKAIENISKLQYELFNGKFKSKGFQEFDIHERGKQRHIQAVHFSERIVQKCLCDYWLSPLLNKRLIYDSGATIKGKGLDFTLKRLKCHLQRFNRKHKTGYVLTIDYSKYFESINHEILLEKVKKVSGNTSLFRLYKYFVNCFENGVGLGSQISQLSALFYISDLDHYIKEKLHCKYYARYMDDCYIISDNKEFLKYCLSEINKKSQDLRLTINRKKTNISNLEYFTILKRHFKCKLTNYIVSKPIRKNKIKLRKRGRYLKEHKPFAYNQFKVSVSGYLKNFSNIRLQNTIFC